MAAITNQSRLHLPNNFLRVHIPAALVSAGLALIVLGLARRTDVWWLSLLAVIAVLTCELWGATGVAPVRLGRFVLDRLPAVMVGLSVIMIIALVPRFATQLGITVLYGGWRMWWSSDKAGERPMGLTNLLVIQAFVFEAVFLMAAIWRMPSGIVMILAWLGAYVSVYAVLSRRGDRAAGVMAAAWGVIVLETAWVLQLWLYTYTTTGGYVLVPQPALVLTALAYCFGGIYASQREGALSRSRLAEYLVIGLVLVAIVAAGTTWRGST